MKVGVKKVHQLAQLPTYGSEGAGCFDLYAAAVNERYGDTTVDTGLVFDIPEDHVMLVFSRSGHGFNHATRLSNCVGIIDSDYTGVVKVKLTTDKEGMKPLVVNVGDRVAQAMIIRYDKVEFEEVGEVEETERGDGGFGSSGK